MYRLCGISCSQVLDVVQHELDKFDFALLRRAGIRI